MGPDAVAGRLLRGFCRSWLGCVINDLLIYYSKSCKRGRSAELNAWSWGENGSDNGAHSALYRITRRRRTG
jgi:hypothetical protein